MRRVSKESLAKEVNQAKMERVANQEFQVCLVIEVTPVHQEGMEKRAKKVTLAQLGLLDL